MKFLSAMEYVQAVREKGGLEWIVHRLIPRRSMVMLMGPPKAGKTRLALDLARHVAQGRDYIGYRTKQAPTLYLQVDQPASEWAVTLDQIAGEGGVDLAGVKFVHPEEQLRPLNILTSEGREWLGRVVQESAVELVVLDVLREIHPAEENDSTEMKRVFDSLTPIFKDCSLLLLHHTRKIPLGVESPDPSLFGRGSSYMAGKVGSLWMLYNKQLRILSRYDEEVKLRAERDDKGLWWFPDVQSRLDLTTKLLALCEEHPAERNHGRLAKVAQERYGVTRTTYYRYMDGRPCIHRLPTI